MTHHGHVALACTELGWRVFPLVPDTKRPLIAGWPEKATTNHLTVIAWWDRWPTAHVGIATGPASNLWVIDIDTKHGIDGYSSFQELCAQLGTPMGGILNSTFTVTTPTGGQHLYLEWAGVDLRNTTNLAPGVDVRAWRGYIHAPEHGGYTVDDPWWGDNDPIVMNPPTALTDHCTHTPPTLSDDTAHQWRQHAHSNLPVTVRRILANLQDTPPGKRNDQLNTTAFLLACLGLDHAECEHWCLQILNSIGAGDSIEQQRRTFQSGWENGWKTRR